MFLQWDDGFRNVVAQEMSERLLQLAPLKLLTASNDVSYRVRQLPPSVVSLSGKRAAFPLGLGHAVDYVANGAALIGFVFFNVGRSYFDLSLF